MPEKLGGAVRAPRVQPEEPAHGGQCAALQKSARTVAWNAWCRVRELLPRRAACQRGRSPAAERGLTVLACVHAAWPHRCWTSRISCSRS